MAGLVDIVLPSGEQATVPQADLAQAEAAGAHVVTSSDADKAAAGGLLGTLGTAALGAGRTATFGLSDQWLAEGANVTQGLSKDLGVQGSLGAVGLDVGRKDMLKAIELGREANPYANMAGEAAGLFLGPGGGVSATGEAVEHAAGGLLGKGLVGTAGSMAARGFVEGAMLGAQHELTEATLGDHDLNGEKVIAGMAKDALLGGALGGGLGAGGYGLGRVAEGLGALRKPPGPIADAVLDEVAGVEGAGRAIKSEAENAQNLVENLRKAGATSEQAAKMTDEVMTMSRAKANAGPLSGLIDEAGAAYAARRAGGNPEMEEALRMGFAQRAQKLAERGEVLDKHALSLKDKLDKVLRGEDALNEVQFAEKSSQMGRLVDASKYETQRDVIARLMQDTDEALTFWEGKAAGGGARGAVGRLRDQWTDTMGMLAKADEAGSASASRDFFIQADKFKRQLDRVAQWGPSYGLPEAVMLDDVGFRALSNRFRSALEAEETWGAAGLAQKESNAAFSTDLGRAQDFGKRYAVNIDVERGIMVPEADAAKIKAVLKRIGSDAETQQDLKTLETMLERSEQRASVAERHFELTPRQQAAVEAQRAAVKEVRATLAAAKKEADVISRIEKMQLEEQGRTLGGIAGLVADIATKPLTTIERLAAVRATTKKVEDAFAKGLEKFFGKKGPEVIAELKPRPKDVVVKEIGEARALAQNPSALQAKAASLVGDLGKHAPKIADAATLTAQRAILYLAKEAPQPSTSIGIIASHKAQPRYSDNQVSAWEEKRQAVFAPQNVMKDVQRGRLNRDAIQAIEFVYPKLFAEMQVTASNYLADLDSKGLLDNMPYQARAAYATLLKVPADPTWKPDFAAMLVAAKAPMQMAPQQPTAAPPGGGSKRPMKLNTAVFTTGAQAIEAGGGA